jgi:hypothetical protein
MHHVKTEELVGGYRVLSLRFNIIRVSTSISFIFGSPSIPATANARDYATEYTLSCIGSVVI